MKALEIERDRRRRQKELFGNPLSKNGHYNRKTVRAAVLRAWQKKTEELNEQRKIT